MTAALKDEDAAHPVASAWRPIIGEIVRAFVRGDYGLAQPVAGVEPVSQELAARNRAYVEEYGATLVELPDEAWETSCAQWMVGHWDVVVDLWTKEEGSSDLVLMLQVREDGAEMRFAVELVYVP